MEKAIVDNISLDFMARILHFSQPGRNGTFDFGEDIAKVYHVETERLRPHFVVTSANLQEE
jgi:hypothetical protein